jgi:hypothetical protein
MKTKICALALAAIALVTDARAQESTTFGLRAGVNFQNLTGEIGGNDLENKLKTGFHIGVNAEIPIAPEFYLQPGVLFSTKGAKSDEDDDVKTNISYVEVPINFLFKPTLGTGKLLLGIGPYIGIAVGGKIKGDGDDVDIEFKNDITANEFATGDPYLKRLDFGGNLLAGYEFSSKFSFQLNAQLGMSNLFPKVNGDKLDNTKMKNTGFGVSLGYRF